MIDNIWIDTHSLMTDTISSLQYHICFGVETNISPNSRKPWNKEINDVLFLEIHMYVFAYMEL